MAIVTSLSYPLQIKDGGLQVSTDYDVIREAIYSVLETRPYERVMQPTYGTPDFIFSTYTNSSIVAEMVRIQLEEQLSGVEFEVTGSIDDSGTSRLSIQWSVDDVAQAAITVAVV